MDIFLILIFFSFFPLLVTVVIKDYMSILVCVVGFLLEIKKFFSILEFGIDSECANCVNLYFVNWRFISKPLPEESEARFHEDRLKPLVLEVEALIPY